MRRMIAVAGAAALMGALIAVAVPATAGASSSTECAGPLAPGTYRAVVVPDGAFCFGDGPVTIRGGLSIGAGATFQLGSDEGSVPTGSISGGVRATNPASVEIHFATINGGIHVSGGSGAFGGPFDVTFTAIEDNVIHGGASVVGYDGFWFGFIRNQVSGSVTLNDNVLPDPDGNEFVTNSIHGNLTCSGNSPAPQVGDSEGLANVVTGQKIGQCAAV